MPGDVPHGWPHKWIEPAGVWVVDVGRVVDGLELRPGALWRGAPDAVRFVPCAPGLDVAALEAALAGPLLAR